MSHSNSTVKMKKGVFLLLTLFLLIPYSVKAQTTFTKLQAIYIYNFAKYINWQIEEPTFTIGIIGKSDIYEELKTSLAKKKAAGKSIEVKVLENISEASKCQIVYLATHKSRELSSLIELLENKPTLIVTEDDLAKKGAGISFFVDGEKLRFKLNKQVLLNSGLKVSEGLLGLAIVI